MHTIFGSSIPCPSGVGAVHNDLVSGPHGARPVAWSPRPSIEHGHGRTATAPFNNQPQAHTTVNEQTNNAQGRF